MSFFMKLLGQSGVTAEVDANNRLQIAQAKLNEPAEVGAVVMASQNDAGTKTGTPTLASPEVDNDSRLRVAQDLLLDTETFNFAAQNTGKHQLNNSTLIGAFAVNGYSTNSTGLTTVNAASMMRTYATFSALGGTDLYAETLGHFTSLPVANTFVEFGHGLPNGAAPFAGLDGGFFRLTSAGLLGVISHNGTELTVDLGFVYAINRTYKFLSVTNLDGAQFWIDGVLFARIDTPIAQGQPFMSAALPYFIRHGITGGAAGGVISFVARGYNCWVGGGQVSESPGVVACAAHGSYQGLSGGAMGSTAAIANGAGVGLVAALPTNTTSAVMTGLGGQGWETDTLGLNADGIICSYQNPAASVSVPGRRLKITGVWVESYVAAAVVGGPYIAQYTVAFGHTALSMLTAEGAASKAPRRKALGTHAVAANAAVGVKFERLFLKLESPIFLNPGEFFAVCRKKVAGTVATGGTIGHLIDVEYAPV